MTTESERLRHGCSRVEEGRGWVLISCDCGHDLGEFPDFITAVDALIDHIVTALSDPIR